MNSTMQIFENQTLTGFRARNSALTFSDIQFRRCHLEDCAVSVTENPNLRTTIRNVLLVDCSENGCSIGNAIVEDVLVENLKSPGLFQSFGAAFNRVVLRGRIDRLMITNDVLPSVLMDERDRLREIDAFRLANAEYYRHVDWALDISRAEFKELDIRGIPSRLIRRDSETQIVVSRERVVEGDWRELDFRESLTSFSLNFMIEEGWPDMVMVAPKRHRKFPFYLHDLQLLREAGIAEPD